MRIKSLDLNEEEVDGCHFFVDKENPDDGEVTWKLLSVVLPEEHRNEFRKSEMGYKYQIVLYSNVDDGAEYFEAIIGDIKYYIQSLVETCTEGFVLKKCPKSDQMIERIFKSNIDDLIKQGHGYPVAS